MRDKAEEKSIVENFLKGNPTLRKRFALITGAIERGELVRFSYTDNYGYRSVRTIKPEEIREYGETVCVAGYCYLRKAERVFALDRMSRARIVKEPGKSYDKDRKGKFALFPKFRKRTTPVVLRDFTNEKGRRYLEAHLTPSGDLELEGQDLGPGLEEVFGEGIREYEWRYLIKKANFPELCRALDAPPGTDILNLLQFRCVGPYGRNITEVIVENNIPHEFWNRIGD